MRARVLREEPLCRLCTINGLVAASTVADHIIALEDGGSNDRANFQGLCDPCHHAKTAREAIAGAASSRQHLT